MNEIIISGISPLVEAMSPAEAAKQSIRVGNTPGSRFEELRPKKIPKDQLKSLPVGTTIYYRNSKSRSAFGGKGYITKADNGKWYQNNSKLAVLDKEISQAYLVPEDFYSKAKVERLSEAVSDIKSKYVSAGMRFTSDKDDSICVVEEVRYDVSRDRCIIIAGNASGRSKSYLGKDFVKNFSEE